MQEAAGTATTSQENLMKKLILAMLGSLAGAALAQSSSVTLYGIIDQGVSRMDNGQSTLSFSPVGLIGRPSSWTTRSATSSRVGVRGSEDLGGGLKANFQIEHRFTPDTGAVEPRDGALAAFWNAQSWVGLSGGLGEVRLGRQFVPAFQIGIRSDPWAYDYNVGGASNFTRGGNGVTMSYNAVVYRTPDLAGFTAEVMVAAGEGGAAVVNAPASRVGRNEGANVQYAAGPLWAGVGYNNSRQEGTPIKNRYWNLGIAYDFGFVRPIVSYSVGNNNVDGNPETRTYFVGATAPLGQGRLRAVAARYDAAVGQNFNASNPFLPQLTGGQNTTKFGLGYEYFLSKRTSAHADVGTAKTEGVSRTTGVEAGIKHIF
jgi:predicted porin